MQGIPVFEPRTVTPEVAGSSPVAPVGCCVVVVCCFVFRRPRRCCRFGGSMLESPVRRRSGQRCRATFSGRRPSSGSWCGCADASRPVARAIAVGRRARMPVVTPQVPRQGPAEHHRPCSARDGFKQPAPLAGRDPGRGSGSSPRVRARCGDGARSSPAMVSGRIVRIEASPTGSPTRQVDERLRGRGIARWEWVSRQCDRPSRSVHRRARRRIQGPAWRRARREFA